MEKYKPKSISIIGYGRFGRTLSRLLDSDFDITIYDAEGISPKEVATQKVVIAGNLREAAQSEVLFFCVPIEQIAYLVQQIRPFLTDQLIVDVCSVKKYPKNLYRKMILGSEVLLSHPMFGPDSSKQGFENLPMVLDRNGIAAEWYDFWQKYFSRKGLKIIEMSAEQHDKIVAQSQAMTHMVGRVLNDFGFKPNNINTQGDKKILEVVEQTCNDSIDLFYSMQNRNPYCRTSRKKLQKSIDRVFKSVVMHRYAKRRIPIYGIQGGRGSFNDEAIHKYLAEHNNDDYKIEYLMTTKKVLDRLDENEIDFGIFAVSNSRGGIVEETKEELGKHKFDVVEIVNIPIRHCVLSLAPIKKGEIKRIMAHPQVFKQCESSLKRHYSGIPLESGRGQAIDNAKIAELLSRGKLPHGTVVMGSRHLADIYDLHIIDEDLQDDPHNTTNFIIVR